MIGDSPMYDLQIYWINVNDFINLKISKTYDLNAENSGKCWHMYVTERGQNESSCTDCL